MVVKFFATFAEVIVKNVARNKMWSQQKDIC